MAGWCDCPHEWRRQGQDVEGLGWSFHFRCDICRKRLKRKSEVGFLSGAPHLLYAPTPTRLELVVTTLRSSTIRSDGSFQGEHGSRITFVEVVEERLVVHSSTR